MEKTFKIGDRIIHRCHPLWGPGTIEHIDTNHREFDYDCMGKRTYMLSPYKVLFDSVDNGDQWWWSSAENLIGQHTQKNP